MDVTGDALRAHHVWALSCVKSEYANAAPAAGSEIPAKRRCTPVLQVVHRVITRPLLGRAGLKRTPPTGCTGACASSAGCASWTAQAQRFWQGRNLLFMAGRIDSAIAMQRCPPCPPSIGLEVFVSSDQTDMVPIALKTREPQNARMARAALAKSENFKPLAA